MPALLAVMAVLFYWKITLTNQYTWLDSPDYVEQVLPWYQFQAGEVHHGRFPLWNPNEWGGHSLIGQAQPGTAFPLNWILFALPFKNGHVRLEFVHWYYVLLHYLGALFCFLLCRDLRMSRVAALAGGTIFGFGGWMATTDWPQMLAGAMWAPLVFLFLLRAIRGERPVGSAALAGAFLGVMFLSGHHQIPVFVGLAACGVWVYGLARSRGRLAGALAVFVVMAGLCSAFQMLPAVEYGKRAVRWVGAKEPKGWQDKVPYSVQAQFALPPGALAGVVIPGLHTGANPFLGVAAVSLALLGVAGRWREPMGRVMAAVALGGLLYALAPYTLFQGVLYAVVPMVEKARNPFMAVMVFHFGAAVLAGYGLDAWGRGETGSFGRRLPVGLGIFAAAIWLILLGLQLGGKPLDRAQTALAPLVAVMVAALLAAWRAGNVRGPVAAALLCAVALAESASYTSQAGWRNRDEGWHLLPRLEQDRDVVEYLRRFPGWRVEVDEEAVPYNFGDWHGIEDFGGYTASLPVNITRVQGNYHARMLFAVRYAVGRKPARANQREVFEGASGLKVYESPEAFPRMWSVHGTAPLARDEDIGPMLDRPLEELRRTAIMKGPAPALESCAGEDVLRLEDRKPNALVLRAAMACRGMVIASETYDPGWQTKVDGKPAEIREVYGALRGVVVPAGEHRIEMRYRPASVRWGAAGTLCGLVVALVLGCFVVSTRSKA
jgi:hypothetical protein